MAIVMEEGLDESRLLVSPLEPRDLGKIFPPIRSKSTLDAILIPGGGLNPDGNVKESIRASLDAAIELQDRVNYIITLSRGTPHRPPVITNDFPVDESVSGANYLLENKVPREKIIVENTSIDTLGNAYFARMITDYLGLRRLLIINPAFRHIRNFAVFGDVFKLPSKRDPKPNYELHYYQTPSFGLTPKELIARLRHELEASFAFDRLIKRITTLEGLSDYIYREHEAYRAGGHPIRISGPALGTF